MIKVKAYNKFIKNQEIDGAIQLYDFLRFNGLENFCKPSENDKYKYYLNSDPIQLTEYILDDGILEILPAIKGGDGQGGGGGGPTYLSSTLGAVGSPTTFWLVLTPNQTNSGYPCPSLTADLKIYTGASEPTTASTPIYTSSYSNSVPNRIGIGARTSTSNIRNLKIYVKPITSLNLSNASINTYVPVVYNDSMNLSLTTSRTAADQVGHIYLGNDINYNTIEVV